ncbi:hypothetical protein HER15_07970 [Tenacibaculum mesophilum]|uniref:Dual OB-containing domain-containing protein n=1 Tax=Tenacibaculum mesophilum TaxID=104268 RepID=A0AAE9SH20_9FLAO|nr:hypothetical protein [Tenacibaculum mesophilum]UTD15404.1 hypothetical protein HER15_07970 [Tenacibaculum mesophilum]
MEVLITSKTQWSNKYCIGALEILTGEYVRLLTSTGGYQPNNSPLQIGDIWDLDYIPDPDRSPHIEDVRVVRRNGFVRNIGNLSQYIIGNCDVWRGDYQSIFDNNLRWTFNGSGYLNSSCNMPTNSVGFWISDQDLELDTINGKLYYVYRRGLLRTDIKLPYKGVGAPIQVIPQGTLIRISLAKWFVPRDINIEERCYAQLSGFY